MKNTDFCSMDIFEKASRLIDRITHFDDNNRPVNSLVKMKMEKKDGIHLKDLMGFYESYGIKQCKNEHKEEPEIV